MFCLRRFFQLCLFTVVSQIRKKFSINLFSWIAINNAFLTIFIVFFSFLNANERSLIHLALTSENIAAAVEIYNTEIQLFEENDTLSKREKKLLSMYNERADLHFVKKNYRTALKDYQKAVSLIENAALDEPGDLLAGICGCLFCYQCLDEDEFAKQEFNKLVYSAALLGEKIELVDWIRDSGVYPI